MKEAEHLAWRKANHPEDFEDEEEVADEEELAEEVDEE